MCLLRQPALNVQLHAIHDLFELGVALATVRKFGEDAGVFDFAIGGLGFRAMPPDVIAFDDDGCRALDVEFNGLEADGSGQELAN